MSELLPSRASSMSPSSPAAAASPDLYALDFDGVICDSCGESSLAAVKAAKEHWPGLFDGVSQETEDKILEDMRTVRPVVETGYENVLLVRLLLEIEDPEHNWKSAVSQGLNINSILGDWEHGIKPRAMEGWNANKDELVHLFGDVRDRWISEDLPGWIAANRLYPGTADALRFASSELYIVTTKQTRFVQLILRELAGVDFPEERIFGLGTGPKVEILRKLQDLPNHEGQRLHFVEDRLATLRNVIKTPALDRWNLFLGDWGYNTEDEREAARAVQRISVIDLETFCSKLR